MAEIKNIPTTVLSETELREFFIDHLNRIYCAKSHMVRRFPELADRANFLDVKNAILETTLDVENQILRISEILALMNKIHSSANCNGMIAMLEEAFAAVKDQNEPTPKRDMAILYYMQNIESLEMASFQLLHMASVKLKDSQISQLLKENYDEAKEDRALFLLITARCLVS